MADKLVFRINKYLDKVPQLGKGFSMFTIPHCTRQVNPEAFSPQLVSIGPFHRDALHLKPMETYKWQLLKYLRDETKIEIKDLSTVMLTLEQETRASYDQKDNIVKISSQDFAEMMLLDGCFIMETLEHDSCKSTSHRSLPRYAPFFIHTDLLMLENQIPLNVIYRLFDLKYGSEYPRRKVHDAILAYFKPYIRGIQPPKEGVTSLHLLQFIHQALLPSTYGPNDDDCKRIKTHSVLRLRESNIKFMKDEVKISVDPTIKQNGEAKLMDIIFDKGVLRIPQFEINDATKPIFINLMAFEHCYLGSSNHVTSYMSFLSGLIDTCKDVQYLREKEILLHTFGSDEEVANLLNFFCKEVAFNCYDKHLHEIQHQINEHFNRKSNKWRAALRKDYLKNPWVILSAASAVTLLLLTLIQTLYCILGYYNPNTGLNLQTCLFVLYDF